MTASILIVTEDETTLEDLLRLCAAAGTPAEVVHGTPTAEQWASAPLVLVGDDRALARQGRRWPGRRPGVLLIARDLDDHTVWARGVALGAEEVVHLPDAEPWLADRVADAGEPPGRPALTIGVLGGRGGVGTSALAGALAVTAARQGHRTVLVDGDPLGGGLDVLLGGERIAGSRWPAFVTAQGRLSGAALEESLPRVHGVSLLSWDRGSVLRLTGQAMRSVLTAARRGGGLVILDLPRTVDEACAEALAHLDLGLLVVPGELRAVAAARRVAGTAGALVRDLRVVARGPGLPGGLAGPELGQVLGLPLAGELPDEPGLSKTIEEGRPPGGNPSGVLAHFCAELLGHALPALGAAA
ncbi:septum site-determining protein Ssd [Streptomyces carpaticus]|uniref:Septum site-determining protein Ssd n=1 Tax=Streptomyces carpaticus TaxID=285558 RepID=A0ABV4ZIU5_9ACTN